jgi:glutaredoxin-dependent peroxiredoxin
MALKKGDAAPAVKLPAKPGEEVQARIGQGKVVLLFFPFAFSSVCTDEMCQMRDTWREWETLDAQVLGISVDSPFVTDRFRAEERIPFPILSDYNRQVASKYGVLHEDLSGFKNVAKRSAFVIDERGKIAYAWVTENPKVMVPFEEIRAALAETARV